MKHNERLTIAVAVNDVDTLQRNLLLSPSVLGNDTNQIIIKKDYPSASLAYNAAIEEAENDLIIFIHQDMYLPEGWFLDLSHSLSYLQRERISWGVLGCFGVNKFAEDGLGQIYMTGLGQIGRRIMKPEPIETLDEIVLIIRKSSGLRFDPSLPYFHLYGTDLCMSARDNGLASYAFQGFCIHNTNQLLRLPNEYYQCYDYLKKKWNKYLPIYTSCIKISRFNEQMYSRKIRELCRKALGVRRLPKLRVDDPRKIVGDVINVVNHPPTLDFSSTGKHGTLRTDPLSGIDPPSCT